MGARGPAPLPSNVKKMQGTYRKARAPQNEPIPDLDAPPCPDWLNDLAQKEWRRVVPDLLALGILAKIDMAVLALYCHALAEVEEMEGVIKKTGLYFETESGYPQIHPTASARNHAIERVKQFGRELGLSASARTRISVPEKKEEEDNPFANLTG